MRRSDSSLLLRTTELKYSLSGCSARVPSTWDSPDFTAPSRSPICETTPSSTLSRRVASSSSREVSLSSLPPSVSRRSEVSRISAVSVSEVRSESAVSVSEVRSDSAVLDSEPVSDSVLSDSEFCTASVFAVARSRESVSKRSTRSLNEVSIVSIRSRTGPCTAEGTPSILSSCLSRCPPSSSSLRWMLVSLSSRPSIRPDTPSKRAPTPSSLPSSCANGFWSLSTTDSTERASSARALSWASSRFMASSRRSARTETSVRSGSSDSRLRIAPRESTGASRA